MEDQPKSNSKEVISFLAEKFPYCFSLSPGKIRPLKIGIFKDLVERLNGQTKLSKAQIRAALRFYTSRQYYLLSISRSVKRVDLDGNDSGLVRDNHITYAQKHLTEKINRGASRPTASARRNSPCTIRVGQKVKIRLGRNMTCATITEVIKDNFRAQTQSGMIVTVSVGNYSLTTVKV